MLPAINSVRIVIFVAVVCACVCFPNFIFLSGMQGRFTQAIEIQ